MPIRQDFAHGDARPDADTGRMAQRRRTRAAILAAATRLISDGGDPSIDDIAAAADVSRRTIYMYFPTVDQLLLDATVGALSEATVDSVLLSSSEAGGSDDAVARVDALVRTLVATASTTLPLGRRIIALTIGSAEASDGGARRGYRRMAWIERAVEPLRGTLSREQLDRLVSALAVVVGWEAMVVLRDVRHASSRREERVMRWAATSLVRAMIAEAVGPTGTA